MPPVLFFDLGDTLVVPQLAADNSLLSLRVLPFVPDILARLKSTKIDGVDLRLGVISNTGTETASRLHDVMAQANLLGFFDPALLLYSSVEKIDKTRKEFFQLAASRANTPPGQCVYVGENDGERQVAASAGFRTSYHALHVFHVIGLV
jgi:FMN phosphatase YigB (HAD superfamily)